MIQLNTTSPFAAANPQESMGRTGDPLTGESFQSALSAALNATLAKFGIDPTKVIVSIAPDAARKAAATSSSTAPSSDPKIHAAVEDPAGLELASFDDSYWAKQPEAIRALRDIDDLDKRSELATQLATQGYAVDVPIMVWGWDPAKVTSLRQSFGYTWVPSAFQDSVEIAPGLSGMTRQPYDPQNPPAGSIAV
jgi:hypothetical protein